MVVAYTKVKVSVLLAGYLMEYKEKIRINKLVETARSKIYITYPIVRGMS